MIWHDLRVSGPAAQEADELLLYHYFAPHGALLSCKILADPVTGRCRSGSGEAGELAASHALNAMALLGTLMQMLQDHAELPEPEAHILTFTH